MANNQDAYKRLRKYLNPIIQGKFTDAILQAIASGAEINETNIVAIKEQMFIATASDQYLERLLAGIGISKPAGIGIDDNLFRELAIKETSIKLVTNIFLDVLETFYGADAVKANSTSGLPGNYALSDGMTLLIKADNNPIPLVVTFSASDFSDIGNATPIEVANVISRLSFNAGYTISSVVELDSDTDLSYVVIYSGTKGPKSSITIVGGSAQNVFRFQTPSSAIVSGGTQFSTSFYGQYVRFTWVGGPNPQLLFLSQGDYVNLYGSGWLDINRGTFTIENVQDGPLGSAYFDIINPTFQLQGLVTVAFADASSSNGIISLSAAISPTLGSASRVTGLTTINTINPHGFSIGQRVTIAGVDNTTFNGTYTIGATPTPSSFTFAQGGADATSNGGTASVSYTVAPLGASRIGGVTTLTTTTPHALTAGQLVTISKVDDSSFNGSFTLTVTGASTISYTQNYTNDIVFFTPQKRTIQKQVRYATVYETSPHELTIFIPATIRIIKRDLIGAWHVQSSSIARDFPGSFIYDTTTGYPITQTSTTLTQTISQGEIKTVIFGNNTSQFPDGECFVVFDYGSANQEGPVKVLARPSSGSLLVDPSYKFKLTHDVGADIALLKDVKPYIPATDGSDRQAYLTGTVNGRLEAQNIIEKLMAAGIFLNIIIVTPEGPGIQDIRGYVYEVTT